MRLKNWKTGIVLTVILLLCCLNATGQEFEHDSISVFSAGDTIDFQTAEQDSISFYDMEENNIIIMSDTTDWSALFPTGSVESLKKHSPAKAAMLSAVVPGLGQIYNKKYWKVPIAYAAIGISAGVFLRWQNEYSRFRRAYIDINDKDPYTNFFDTIGFPQSWTMDAKSQYITKRKEELRTWRDWSIVALVIAYAMNVIDANVDAHLMDFSVDENISLNIKPCFFEKSFDSQKIGLSLRLSF